MKKLTILLLMILVTYTLGVCQEKLAPKSIMFDYENGLRIQGTSIRLKLPKLEKINSEDDFDTKLIALSTDIINEYPYLRPVYLIRLNGKVDKTIFDTDTEFIDIAMRQYALGLVTEEQARVLHSQGESLYLAYEINTSNHGRQVFFPDENGNWFGLKGIGVPPAYKAAHPTQGVTGNKNFGFHESIDDATGVVLVSERMEGLMRQEKSRSNIEYATREILNRSGLFAGIGIANIVLEELWDGVESQKLPWDRIASNRVYVNSDSSIFTPLVRVGINVELLYYGKHPPLRIRDLHEMNKAQMETIILRSLGLSRTEINVNREVVEAYLIQTADQLAQDFSVFLNHAQVHNIPFDGNIIVDGHLTDFEVVTDIPLEVNDFFGTISHSSIVRDLTYINESLRVLVQIINKLSNHGFASDFAQSIFEQKLREYATDQGALSLMQITIGQVFIYLDYVLQARHHADSTLVTTSVPMSKMSQNDIELLRQRYSRGPEMLGRIIRASNFNTSIPALKELQRNLFLGLAFPRTPADAILKCEDDEGFRYRLQSYLAWQNDGDLTMARTVLRRLFADYYRQYILDVEFRRNWIQQIRIISNLDQDLILAA